MVVFDGVVRTAGIVGIAECQREQLTSRRPIEQVDQRLVGEQRMGLEIVSPEDRLESPTLVLGFWDVHHRAACAGHTSTFAIHTGSAHRLGQQHVRSHQMRYPHASTSAGPLRISRNVAFFLQ